MRTWAAIWCLALGRLLAAELTPPAPLPPTPSPVEHFRQMLAVSGEEREKLLAGWNPAKREVLRRKCVEYDAMDAQERERRLRMIELRWYLHPLMTAPKAERTPLLGTLPEEFKGIVTERLAQWDALPEEVRTRLVENEMALQYFARLKQSATGQAPASLAQPSAEQRELEEKLAAWRGLNPKERRKSSEQFNRFFELPRAEREKTLQVLSETDRREMEKTLAAFAKLPPAQREVCIESFRKLANLEPKERQQFLRNAARWQAMSPEERQQWKVLVTHLPPTPQLTVPPPLP